MDALRKAGHSVEPWSEIQDWAMVAGIEAAMRARARADLAMFVVVDGVTRAGLVGVEEGRSCQRWKSVGQQQTGSEQSSNREVHALLDMYVQ